MAKLPCGALYQNAEKASIVKSNPPGPEARESVAFAFCLGKLVFLLVLGLIFEVQNGKGDFG